MNERLLGAELESRIEALVSGDWRPATGDLERVFAAIIASMGRIEKRLFAIADQIAKLAEEQRQLQLELDHHRDMADDIERDAVISEGRFDRMEAGLARADVGRFERRLAEIGRKRAKLEETRTKLLSKLES